CIPVIKVVKKECEKVLADLNDENFLFNPSDKYEIRPAYLLDRYHWSVVDTMVIEEIAAEEEKILTINIKSFLNLRKIINLIFVKLLRK
ncbi:MAG: hypothetical protein LUD81_00230, partial [Clostridiales bacterium]|nr:hypothetical protein [Clostridiales bacterium]